MPSGLRTVIYPVTDLAAATAVFTALLGQGPTHEAPYYVQFDVETPGGTQQLGLDPSGAKQGMTGPIGYWQVDDVEASVQALVAAGATVRTPVRDFGGRKVAVVDDADGNPIGLSQEG